MRRSLRVGGVVVAIIAAGACGNKDNTSNSTLSAACPWDPGFGLVDCNQNAWWMEFSVSDTTTTAMTVEVSGTSRVISLPTIYRVDSGHIKFAGSTGTAPVPAGTLVRVTATHSTSGGPQSATSNWFAYMNAAPVFDCPDAAVTDAAPDAPSEAAVDGGPIVDASTDASVSCAWNPDFGLVGCTQNQWWMEFSVEDLTTSAMNVEVYGTTRVINLPTIYRVDDTHIKFAGSTGAAVPAGTLVRVTATHPFGGGTQSATSDWFAYMNATPVLDCPPSTDGGVTDGGVTDGGVTPPPDAGTVVTLASGQDGPTGIAIDNANVYWTNSDDGTVMQVPINGGTPIQLASGQGNASNIAVNGTSVFWTNTSGGTVMRCAIGGCGGAPTALASGQSSPLGIAADATRVYWVSSVSDGTVKSVPVGGGASTTLASGQNTPWGIAVDHTNAYWTNNGAGTVMKCAVGGCGGAPTTLASTPSNPKAITVDATRVYWIGGVAPLPPNPSLSQVTSVPIGGGSTTALVSGLINTNAGIAVDSTNVYFFRPLGQRLSKVPLGGGTASSVIAGLSTPIGVAVDSTNIYWTERGAGTVKKIAK